MPYTYKKKFYLFIQHIDIHRSVSGIRNVELIKENANRVNTKYQIGNFLLKIHTGGELFEIVLANCLRFIGNTVFYLFVYCVRSS